MQLVQKRNYPEAAELAAVLTERYPDSPLAWKVWGLALLESRRPQQAIEVLHRADGIDPEDPDTLHNLGIAYLKQGNIQKADHYLGQALEVLPSFAKARLVLAKMRIDTGQYQAALEQIAIAEEKGANENQCLSLKAFALNKLHRHTETLQVQEEIRRRYPDDLLNLSNLADSYRMLTRFDEAEKTFLQLLERDPTQHKTFSGYLFAIHYNPRHSQEFLVKTITQWDERFSPPHPPRAQAEDRSPDKRLKIGLLSAGFRVHPVGQMITSALEHLPRNEFELIAYTTSSEQDDLTQRIRQRCDDWQAVMHLDDMDLAKQIRDDKIDILIDLCGHSEGSRLPTMAQEPAPLQIKWVGGLNNTTGLKAIDYLISDSVETPPGVDHQYVEKLIRLPDDYICYQPRPMQPHVGPLPALTNGYVTFGCFNNPSKVNEIVIEHWASIMAQIPASRLMLKGGQYENQAFIERISQAFETRGIERTRLKFEGQSPHLHLLNTYNQVDIALDPWPYSGGLTTCEALLMGVPVITYPGPSFAGRHSATHLVNAGLAELVADGWEHYRSLAVGLASDLDTLATIRQGLRQQLKNSPVCDAPRFARHFTIAMRAIWQRYCEGKEPAALTIGKQGEARFADDKHPMHLLHPATEKTTLEEAEVFRFALEGKIVTVDNGSILASTPGFTNLQKLGAFATIAFDPSSKVKNAQQLQQQGELHHYPHVVLGDGQDATLHVCLDPAMSATLEPLPADEQLSGNQQATRVIARLPISTLQLDDIEGLESIDWLLLDNLNDSLKILEHGAKSLAATLLIQARVNFLPTHKRQPELTLVSYWLSRHGFSFYRLNNLQHYSHLPTRSGLYTQQATQLTSADALFIPNASRMAELKDNQRLKLAFVLHTVYGIQDLSYALLEQINPETALVYLSTNNLIETKPDFKDQAKYIDSPTKESCKPEYKNQAPALLAIREPQPKVFVGIPVYNEEKYIEKTIESLKSQSMDGVGFLISDNHSTDRTLEIIQDTVGSDDRFKISQQDKNLGSFENFKFVFENTESQYFLWLGAHDYLSTDYLQLTTEALDKDKSISMACGMPYAVFNDKTTGPTAGALYDFNGDSPVERYMKSVARLTNCTVFHSLFRREALNDFDFRKVISCDHVIISHLLWHGKLAYAGSAKYYRRYFEKRQESYEERLSGKGEELPRRDLYKLYEDDFTTLAKSTLNTNELMTQIKKMQDILKKRFN
ncbi:glycosyl transferase,TPR repeat protein [Azotobacter vinelandii CA]|uniref:protein O-GlcNAc transferase n=3 Tax=Azotobacter group TaxID=351 RepID=C1DKU1_AZOVD|nr:glycosyl transferase,TPR repeat protein [Azotobacter vinelandii DJ]AGK14853.1 glycosyl transferase,TPR repeat protein [Azotobacter vinelandii CA]AGK20864.1 glycosyl transferase,TPR repeat protein [Azotobacter vinelandii CA6]GLK59741.1 hypothetical protein GCM10017624_18980 [Azotobacter vinelandii]SFY12128.1 Predicted O-linked N-acetylglucosamine transferase, SPINDLY family [Azotobacter vinelandii]